MAGFETDDVMVLRWPSWAEVRAFIRGVLGIRARAGESEGDALQAACRRYDDVSRCC
jgi:hypothetical protein